MSFVTALYPVYGGSEDDPPPTYPDLSSLKNQATFVLNNGKIIDLLQVSIVDKENKLKLFSDVQKYLCNSQKLLYLQNIEFNVSPILYWLRPETGLYIAVRDTISKLSGVEDHQVIESVLYQNMGIFDFFPNFLKINTNVFQFSLQKGRNFPDNLAKSILSSLIEWLHYQKFDDILSPVFHSVLMSQLFNFNFEYIDISQKGLFSRSTTKEYNCINFHFHCFVCDINFASNQDLTEHLKSHTGFSCDTCEIEYENHADKVCHSLTFCRQPHDKTCSFCQKTSKDCTCVTYHKKTLTEIRAFLQNNVNSKAFSQNYFSEIIQYFKDNSVDKSKFKAIIAIDDQNEVAAIPDDFWPKITVLDNEDWDQDQAVITIFNNDIPFIDIKNNITHYDSVLGYLESKLSLMPYFRSSCIKKGCNFAADSEHYFTTHFFCPLSLNANQDELFNYMDFDEMCFHLAEHVKDSWSQNNKKYCCKSCDFTIEDKVFLPIMINHAIQHKYQDFLPQCQQAKAYETCKDITFDTYSEFINHLIFFHFDVDLVFKNLIINLLKFEVKEKLPSSSKFGTPKLNIPKVPRSLVKQQSTIKDNDNDDDDNDDNNNDNDVNDDSDDTKQQQPQKNGDKKSELPKRTNFAKLSTSHHDGKKIYLCKNEGHPTPLQFKTKDSLDAHIMRMHQCWYANCNFFNMYDSIILAHVKQTHLCPKEKCPLCKVPVTDQQQHNIQHHCQCQSCAEWFLGAAELQKHEPGCHTLSDDPVPLVEEKDASFVASKTFQNSLKVDLSATDSDFAKFLILMMERSNLSQEEMKMGREIISKHSSESLITKSRLRSDNFSTYKNLDLLFDLPNFSTGGKEAVNKIQSYLGVIKDSDIFDAMSVLQNKNV